jgi:hypothetical protein
VLLNPSPVFTEICPLLPRLNSLILVSDDDVFDGVAQYLSHSTSLKLLSLSLEAIEYLDSDTQTIIGGRIEVLRVVMDSDGWVSSGQRNALSAIISSSRMMKKVILDGSGGGTEDLLLMRILARVCEKAKVELWKENFETGNGKVDLNSK